MLYLTNIIRVSDQLPLVEYAAIDSESLHVPEKRLQQQKKELVSKLLSQPGQSAVHSQYHSFDSLDRKFTFHLLISEDVCYMTVCEANYKSDWAVRYLDELRKEFMMTHGKEIHQVETPYAFCKFEVFIQKTRRIYSDTRSIQELKTQLNDVQKIMKKNIDEIIGRGRKLEEISHISNELADRASRFKTSAVTMNRMYLWKTYGPVLVVLFIVFFVYYMFRNKF